MFRTLAILLQTLPVQNFPPIDHPGVDPELHAKVLAICPARDAEGRGALLKREDRLADSVRTRDSDTSLWFRLACTRALLGDANAIAHAGPLQPAGAAWHQGAINGLLKVLAVQPIDAKAAELLALLSLDDAHVEGLDKIVIALRRAVDGGLMSAPVLRACTNYALATADTAGSRECIRRALAAGRDSTWQMLRMARLSFQQTDTATGNRLFQSAAGAAHDSLAYLEITWHLQWLLTPDEQHQWLDVPDAARKRWVRDRLAARDIRDGQPAGARLAEHFKRLAYVEAHFQLAVPRRLERALLAGPATPEGGALCGDITSCSEPGGVWARSWREYRRWQPDFDDRGVIWMRFGAPDRLIPWVCSFSGCDIVREAWVYDLDNNHMLLSFENEAFDGSVQPTRLVSGVLGSYFCDIDARRCMLNELSRASAFYMRAKNAARPSSAMVKPEQIEMIRRQDIEAISAATTHDDNSPRGDKFIDVMSRFHRLWDPASGVPIVLVTYAVPLNNLKLDKGAEAETADVQLQLLQWDPSADRRTDTTMARRFTVPAAARTKELTGFVLQQSTPGVTAWNLVITQADRRRGRAFEDPSAPLGTGPVVLSDLVIGAASEQLRWNTGGNAILLAPLNSVDRDEPVELYYQVRSAAAAAFQTTVALYRAHEPQATAKPALEVTYETSLQPGINETAPMLDVSRLDKGEYRLEVRLVNAAGKLQTRRETAFVLR